MKDVYSLAPNIVLGLLAPNRSKQITSYLCYDDEECIIKWKPPADKEWLLRRVDELADLDDFHRMWLDDNSTITILLPAEVFLEFL